MGNRCIITYAAGPHEEILDISLPTYRTFADRHGYDLIVGQKMTDLPPAWNKVPLLLDAFRCYDEVVWFDCDLVIVNYDNDFPSMVSNPAKGVFTQDAVHSLVRHFEDDSEVPNSGVWRLRQPMVPLLKKMLDLEVFRDHGWWEQAALMTLMGYTVPPQGSEFPKTKCRCVNPTRWHRECQFMRVCWNSHPNYRSDKPHIVHCSYPNMLQRIEVMRALVKDPNFDYPRYDKTKKEIDKEKEEEE